MRERGSVPRALPSAAGWAATLLTSGTEALLGAVRNYLGPVKTPYDKRDLVMRLEAFLRRPETRESALDLLDDLDARILGTSLLVGPATEQSLKDFFLGELPLFELGLRISNLLDRLLLFRYVDGGKRLVAVNPLLADDIRARVADPALLFGAGGQAGSSESFASGTRAPEGLACDAAAIVGFFAFLFHSPSSLRKGGGLTKRAAERAGALFRGLAPGSGGTEGGLGGDSREDPRAEALVARLDTMARALIGAGALRSEGELWTADRAAFAELVEEWGECLPFLLASLLARSDAAGDAAGDAARDAEEERGAVAERDLAAPLARLLARAFAALPEGLALSRPGLSRWLRIAARLSGGDRIDALVDPAAAIASLEALGLASAAGPAGGAEGIALAARGAASGRGERADPGPTPTLVAEGAHALHLLPEAGLGERLFVGCLARPSSFGKVWSFEVDREAARSAFASGLGAAAARARLESLSGRPLPQSLAFSLAAWEEEYRSLRLYRGLVLVADERQRPVVERGIASGALLAERLAPGVYFLSAAGSEEAAAQLARAGLEAPPEVTALESAAAASLAERPRARSAWPSGEGQDRDDALCDLELFARRGAESGADRPTRRPLDPEPRLAELRSALAGSGRSAEETKELRERIERRLVLTAEQIARSDPRPDRMEAGGLDYLGKVRVVERALRSPGDRLEVLYRLPGAEPVRALLRPVRLDKNDKGLVLEAEDLGTGGPARVPLGAVSTVRRVRASLFGEEA